jgi:hypothetical protein
MSDADIAFGRTHGRSHPSLQRIVRKKPRKRFRGVPAPLTFDLDALPDNALLSQTEVAAACRRPLSAVEAWRKQPDHPLRWRRVAGRRLCELWSLRAFLKGTE